MSQKLFQASCEMLWGPRYQREASRHLGIALRSAVRYDQGDRAVPVELLERLRELLLQKDVEIAKLIGKLAKVGGAS